jgi:hypothetical protein
MREMQVRKFNSFEEADQADREQWAAIPPDERVSILEEMRAEWEAWRGDGHQGLRRTVRILQQPQR